MKINQAFTILQKSGGLRAARIITDGQKNMPKIKVLYYAWLLRRGMPVAKIIHRRWFYGLEFYTNSHTLDPRPDTETLVAAVISDCASEQRPNILDLGTGTGCIIASLVKNIPGSGGTAVDVSRGALRVARRNMQRLGLCDRVRVMHRSFMSSRGFNRRFDIIVSNPPYIARGDNRVDAGAMHDPHRALFASDGGYAAYAAIAKNAVNWIAPSGRIYLEIGIDMGARVREIFTAAGWRFVRSENDLGGVERVLVFAR